MTASKGLRPALLFLSSGRPDYRLDLGAEALKRNDCIECLEWITLRADRFETLVEIEKAQLSHRRMMRQLEMRLDGRSAATATAACSIPTIAPARSAAEPMRPYQRDDAPLTTGRTREAR